MSWNRVPEWLEDELPRIREVLDPEAWLALPTGFDIHEWAIMDAFARSVEDSELSDELAGALRGRGAFRYFKDALHRHGVQQSWYRYRAAALTRIAVEWLDGHGVPYVRDDDEEVAGGAEQGNQPDGQKRLG